MVPQAGVFVSRRGALSDGIPLTAAFVSQICNSGPKVPKNRSPGLGTNVHTIGVGVA